MAGEGVTFSDQKMKAFFRKVNKNTKDIEKRDKQFWSILTAISFKDVMDHFEKQKGPKKKWKKWSDMYDSHMTRIGKGGNKILQDTGRLRQSLLMANTSSRIKKGQLLYNPAQSKDGKPYARDHNEGKGKLPQREFMWLSGKAMGALVKAMGAYTLKGTK